MNIIAGIFAFFGILVTINAVSIHPDTSIHQIYEQLVYLTGVVLLIGACILYTLNDSNKKD